MLVGREGRAAGAARRGGGGHRGRPRFDRADRRRAGDRQDPVGHRGALARLRADGVAVAWAACRQDGGAPPYWPWVQLLARLGQADALARRSRPSPSCPVPAVRGRGRRAAGRRPGGARARRPALGRRAIAAAARRRSARTSAPRPVLVLGTYRDTEPGLRPGAGSPRTAGSCCAGCRRPNSGPALSDATGETIGPAVVGGAAPAHRRQPVLRRRGRPSAARRGHVSRRRRAGGAQRRPGGARPPGRPAARRGTETVLRAAAALDAGTTTGVDAVLLAAVAGVAPAELAGAARTGGRGAPARSSTAAGTGSRTPSSPTPSTARTPPAQRLELHRARRPRSALRVRAGVGDPAEASRTSSSPRPGCPGTRTRPRRPPQRCAAAAAGGDGAAPPTRTPSAGWRPASRCSPTLRRRAGPDRGELLCALGEAALAAGDPARSRRAFTEAAAQARRHRPSRAARRRRARPDRWRGRVRDRPGRPGPGRRCSRRRSPRCPRADSALRCAVSARLSVALAFTGGEQRRRDARRRRGRDGPPARRPAGAGRRAGGPLRRAGRPRSRRRAGGPAADGDHRVRPGASGTATLELLGPAAAAARAGRGGSTGRGGPRDRRLRPGRRAVRQPGLTWYVPLWRGARATMRGDAAAEAEHDAELARQVERSGSVNAELLALTQRFVREVLAGRPGRASSSTGSSSSRRSCAAASYCTMALLRAVAGNCRRRAARCERHLVARRAAPPTASGCRRWCRPRMTAVLIGHHEAGGHGLRGARAVCRSVRRRGDPGAGTWGCVDAHLGRLARLLGRPDDGPAAPRRGGASSTRQPGRPWPSGPAGGPSGTTASRGRSTWPLAEDGMFRRDGEVWTLAYAGRVVRLRDTQGPARPRRAARPARPGTRRPRAHRCRSGVANAAVRAGRPDRDRRLPAPAGRPGGRSGPRPRRCTTRSAPSGPRPSGTHCVDELAAVTGLGGRARRAGSDAERMRKAVGNRIRQALRPNRGRCIPSWDGICGCPCGRARSVATSPTAMVRWQLSADR